MRGENILGLTVQVKKYWDAILSALWHLAWLTIVGYSNQSPSSVLLYRNHTHFLFGRISAGEISLLGIWSL
jgi:hypothetical protein